MTLPIEWQEQNEITKETDRRTTSRNARHHALGRHGSHQPGNLDGFGQQQDNG